jgi:hypothetical protein
MFFHFFSNFEKVLFQQILLIKSILDILFYKNKKIFTKT